MTWEEIIEKVAKDLHDNSFDGVISPEMVKHTAEHLMSSVFNGYEKSFDTPGLGTKDFAMLQAIEKNVFVFSGFKNYQQLKETSLLLKDKDGNIRSFDDFLADVKKVDATYNRNYLQAEYNHAHSASTFISKWQTMQAEKDALPYIRIMVVLDDRTRHANYNGLRLPVDHPFWKQRFPPFDWNCRCDAVQDSEGAVTPDDEVPNLKDVPPMWRNNAGINGIVFPEHHPYFSAPKAVQTEVKKQAAKLIPIREPKTFTPAKNLQEAEDRLKAAGVKNVNLKGLKADEMNAVLSAIENENNIKAISLDKVTTYRSPGSTAKALYSSSNNSISINLSKLSVNEIEKLKPYETQLEELKKLREDFKGYIGDPKYKQSTVLARINALNNRIYDVTQKIENGETARYWTVSSMQQDKAKGLHATITHELGHYRHYKFIGEHKYFPFDKAKSITEYGRTNEKEYFAEWFCHYRIYGEKGVPKFLLDLFKTLE